MQNHKKPTAKALLTAFLVLVFVIDVKSQAGTVHNDPWWKGLVIETDGLLGKQVRNFHNYPQNGSSEYFNLNIAVKCFGTRYWHSYWRYPQVGIAFLYGYLGNPDVLGSNFSLLPNLTLESRDHRRIITDVTIGGGLSWFNKPFDRVKNPDNLIIGTHITDIVFLSWNLRKSLGRYFALTGGLSFIHCSDGHYQLPNLGMNTFAFNVGLKYYPYGKPTAFKDSTLRTVIDKRLMWNVRLGYGVHEFGTATQTTGSPKYPVYILNVYASKRVGKISNLHAGIFLSYDAASYDYIYTHGYYKKKQRMNSCVLTVFLGHEFILGRFGLIAQSGINVFNPFRREYLKMTYGIGIQTKIKTWWSNKMGVQFYLLKPENNKRFNIWIGTYIKANFFTADYIESSVGIRF